MLVDHQGQHLVNLVSGQTRIITANRRLQRALVAALATEDWQLSPAAYAADDWLREQWSELQDMAFADADCLLISNQQATQLWQELIEADPDRPPLLSARLMARQAAAAAALAEEWLLDLDDPAFDERTEYHHFRRWYRQFKNTLDERRLITSTGARARVEHAIATGALPSLDRILLYGFDDIAPQLKRLFATAAKHVVNWEPAAAASSAVKVAASDIENELRMAALWARQAYQKHPDGRFAVVVPQLTQRRAQVERIFSEVFEADSWLPERPRQIQPFNFSAGVSLATTALVTDAFLLLSLNSRQASADDWRRLLLSPFWGNSLDPGRRLALYQLNRSTKPYLRVTEVRQWAQDRTGEDDTSFADTRLTPQLTHALTAHSESLRRQPQRQSLSAWAEFFADQLELCGWPGERVLDSAEFQQRQYFFNLLSQLAQCDAVFTQPTTWSAALNSLRDIAEATVFQPQTQPSPIQILGLLEAAGLEFDGCWISDMSDLSWPPAAKPNPFLPLRLQSALGMPRATPERELHYAEALTQRLQQCAREVIFSWPAYDDEVHLQPSRLLAAVPEASPDDFAPLTTELTAFAESIAATATFESFSDETGPPWPDLQTPLPGGTGSLRVQALCPFNAFALYRLGAYPQETPVPGLSGAERGTMLHELLAALWQNLQSHDHLVQLGDDDLTAQVEQTADAVLAQWRRRRSDVLRPRYFRLEHRRLTQLALAWLETDRQRPPFEVVACERQQMLEVMTTQGAAQLRGRVDRMDRLASGRELVIDYKTGGASLQTWQGDRPADLQLPLYALSQRDQVSAIAFAEVNAKGCSYTGVGDLAPEDGDISGICRPSGFRNSQLPESWDDALTYWQTAASELVQEFVEGRATAVIYNPSQAQFYDYLLPLNRLVEN